MRSSESCGPVSILLVEPDGALRRSLVSWLRRAMVEYTILEAANAEQVALVAPSASPCVVVVDIACPYVDGEEIVKSIKGSVPRAAIVALTMCDEGGYGEKLMAAGASDSLLIWDSHAELPPVIRAILAGASAKQEAKGC